MATLRDLTPAIGANASAEALIKACPSRRYQRCFFRQLTERYSVMAVNSLMFDDDSSVDDSSVYDSSVNDSSGGSSHARCTRPNAHALVLIGIPSTPSALGRQRRKAIRSTWLRQPFARDAVIACFLLSSRTAAKKLEDLRQEHRRFRDLLFLDAPETPDLLRSPTKYSGYRKLGRGMPTFKQFAFFQFAATQYASVPFVGKVDDDSAVALSALVPLLRGLVSPAASPSPISSTRPSTPLRSPPPPSPPLPLPAPLFALIGAIHWSGFVPRSLWGGIRGDRCAFGWSLHAALSNFGAASHPCDVRGALLPFPYAAGAGYVLSQPLLQWVATSADVVGWVADASGPTREALQWQKNEDTSTGYWLSYAPFRVRYIDIGRHTHDIMCAVDGERRRRGGATYRPPSNTSLIVHNLKTAAALTYTWVHMQRHTSQPYDHEQCITHVHHGRGFQ